MIEEIVGGLRNALERGVSLDKAVASFISAGYNPIEVRQAAQSLSYLPQTLKPVNSNSFPRASIQSPTQKPVQSSSDVQYPQMPQTNPYQNQAKQNQQTAAPSSSYQNNYSNGGQPMQRQNQRLDYSNMYTRRGSKNRGLIILLVVLMAVLIGGLAYMIFFGQELLESILG